MFLFKRKVYELELEVQEAASVEIEKDTIVLGSLSVTGIREGNFFVKDTITITIDTHIVGEITAANCIIDGKVVGNIVCTGHLQLGKTAVIEGQITTKNAVMESGCIVNGKVILNKNVTAPILAIKVTEAENLIKKLNINPPSDLPKEAEASKKSLDVFPNIPNINKENQIVKKQKPVESVNDENSNWW